MQKADNLHRAIAKAIDLGFVGVLCTIPSVIGIFLGGLYILISDGFLRGQSIGKKLLGLRVNLTETKEGRTFCSFRESIIRNLPFTATLWLGSIPFVGWFVLLPLGTVFLIVEAYFVYADDRGIRVGDMYAGTQVVNESSPH